MKWFIVVLTALTYPLSAWSVDDWKATPQERQMCEVMIATKARAFGVDRKANDPDWMTLNHYCDCLRFYNRALSNRGRRDYFIHESLLGCNYVLDHVSEGFALRPEMHLRNGMSHDLLGNKAVAEGEYRQALYGAPFLAEAYLALGEIYMQRKNKDKAMQFIVEGLRYAPDSKGLKRRYKEWGGKEPFPEPYKPKLEPAPVSESKPSTDAKPQEPEKKPASDYESMPAPTTKAVASPAAPNIPIGSPTNPWCRFCPDPAKKVDPETSRLPTEPTGPR